MPNRPRKPCSTPGCVGAASSTGRSGRCDRCRVRRRAAVDTVKGTAVARGYDRRWRVIRLRYLTAHPWCCLCPSVATVADHYPVSRRDLVAADVPDPDADHRLRPLCHTCHGRETSQHQPGGWNARHAQ